MKSSVLVQKTLFYTLLTGVSLSWADSPYQMKAQFHGLSYASAYNEGSTEARYRFSFRKDVGNSHFFDYALQADLWKLTPREAADWIDVPEVYANLKLENVSFKLGRILPEWGSVDFYSPVQDLFPKFSIDPLSYQKDGFVGLYGALDLDSWQFELLWNALFIPTRGGVRFETDDSGHFYVASRWGPPLHYRVNIGEANIPLDYNLHIPELKDVVFKNGGFIRTSYNSSPFRLSLIAANVPDPEPKIEYDAKLHILDESSLMGRVNLYPGFDRLWFLGVETQYIWRGFTLFNECAYLNHEVTAPQQLKGITGFTLKIPSYMKWITGVSYRKLLEDRKTSRLSEITRSNPYFFSRVETNLFSWLSLAAFMESNFMLNDTVTSLKLAFSPRKNLEFSSGVDLLAGVDDSYWGQFRSHDRLWIKMRYEL